jgi:hypothetical protein
MFTHITIFLFNHTLYFDSLHVALAKLALVVQQDIVNVHPFWIFCLNYIRNIFNKDIGLAMNQST